MAIIYVPFDVDAFWMVLELGLLFGFLGFIFWVAHMYGGINPRGRLS